MKLSFFVRSLFVLGVLVGTGCGPRSVADIRQDLLDARGRSKGVQLKDVRTTPPNRLLRTFEVPRQKFVKSFQVPDPGNDAGRTAFDAVRIVRVFERQSASSGLPEYRLFGIHPGSPYALLGLQTGDVLVAADDWVLFDPNKFKQYIYLLQQQPGGQIEIRRGGEPQLLVYRFVD